MDIADFLKILNELPMPWKIAFVVVFFMMPKIIQTFGGGKVVQAAISRFFTFNMEVIRRYQARKSREIEDDAYEVYTRTLIIESLGLFSERLTRLDHKVNHILQFIDRKAEIEEVEKVSPLRGKTETVAHTRVHERLRKLRAQTEEMRAETKSQKRG